MPCWYYEKKHLRNTPSIRDDGLDFETERRYRREGARFIMECGKEMLLGKYFFRVFVFMAWSPKM